MIKLCFYLIVVLIIIIKAIRRVIKCEEYILSDTMTIKTECDKIINDKYETKKIYHIQVFIKYL